MQRQTGGTRGNGHAVSDILERIDSLDELDEMSFEGGADDTAAHLSDDDVFNILYNSLRRDIIAYLQEQGGASTVSDIAEHIAAKENDTTVQQLSSYERKRVYIGLYQNHLPMMDDVGVVEYDKNRGTVRLRECATQLEPYLGDVDDSNGSRITLGGSVVLAGMILFGILDVGTLELVPDPLLITSGAIGLVGLAAFDAYTDRHARGLPPWLTERTARAIRRVTR